VGGLTFFHALAILVPVVHFGSFLQFEGPDFLLFPFFFFWAGAVRSGRLGRYFSPSFPISPCAIPWPRRMTHLSTTLSSGFHLLGRCRETDSLSCSLSLFYSFVVQAPHFGDRAAGARTRAWPAGPQIAVHRDRGLFFWMGPFRIFPVVFMRSNSVLVVGGTRRPARFFFSPPSPQSQDVNLFSSSFCFLRFRPFEVPSVRQQCRFPFLFLSWEKPVRLPTVFGPPSRGPRPRSRFVNVPLSTFCYLIPFHSLSEHPRHALDGSIPSVTGGSAEIHPFP